MKYYQVNQRVGNSIHENLSNMDPVLTEIAMTYRILEKLLSSYGEAATIPVIDQYRTRLQSRINIAVRHAESIVDDTRKLSAILAALNEEVAKL